MKTSLFALLALTLGGCSQAQSPPAPSPAAPPASSAARMAANVYPAPIAALVQRGLTIKGELPAPPGYKGYLADYAGQPVPVYLLPDGKHAVIGALFDAAGRDLTQGPLAEASMPVLPEATWKRLSDATWIAEGASHPKRIVYSFTDTECPYCHKLWQATQPLLAGGDVQVRYVMVAVIAPQSLGRAAAVLEAAEPAAAMRRHEAAFGHSPITPLQKVPAAVAERIQANNALMAKLGIAGTPGTLYKDSKGRVRMAVGMLPPDQIRRIFGP